MNCSAEQSRTKETRKHFLQFLLIGLLTKEPSSIVVGLAPPGHYAEYAGYFEEDTSFLSEIDKTNGKPEHFYDSNTGKLLFTAPIDRSWDDFLNESHKHGWPSFRDHEVCLICV